MWRVAQYRYAGNLICFITRLIFHLPRLKFDSYKFMIMENEIVFPTSRNNRSEYDYNRTKSDIVN